MTRPYSRQVALAFCPKLSSGLSIVGSSWIILEVLRDKKKQALVYHRLLLGLSCLDVLVSSAWFCSTWPIPSEAQGVYGNVGNTASCNVQGFFIQLKAGNPFYNSWLALYFVAVVKFGWTETQLGKVEPYLHGSACIMAIATSTASLILDLFGNANLWCWIESSYPLARLIFFYVWYWSSLIVVTISMLTVVYTVGIQERASLRYSTQQYHDTATVSKDENDIKDHTRRPQQQQQQQCTRRRRRRGVGKNTRKVATQAVLYIGAYYLTALFSTIVRTMQAFRSSPIPFWALLGMTLLYPAQGFMNFLIYVRPRYLRYRQKHPEWSLRRLIKETLLRAIRGAASATLGASSMGTTTADVVNSEQDNNDDDDDDDDEDYKLGTPLEQDDETKINNNNSNDVVSAGTTNSRASNTTTTTSTSAVAVSETQQQPQPQPQTDNDDEENALVAVPSNMVLLPTEGGGDVVDVELAIPYDTDDEDRVQQQQQPDDVVGVEESSSSAIAAATPSSLRATTSEQQQQPRAAAAAARGTPP